MPEFSLGNDTVICEQDQIILFPDTNFTEITAFLWQDNSADTTFIVTEAGMYFLKTTDKCGSFTDTVFIETKYCGPIFIPNVFTPNGDEFNQFFVIKGIEEEQWLLEVYSRWGNLVFRNPNYKNTWQAKNVTGGVYYYVLYNPSSKKVFKGYVHVIK